MNIPSRYSRHRARNHTKCRSFDSSSVLFRRIALLHGLFWIHVQSRPSNSEEEIIGKGSYQKKTSQKRNHFPRTILDIRG